MTDRESHTNESVGAPGSDGYTGSMGTNGLFGATPDATDSTGLAQDSGTKPYWHLTALSLDGQGGAPGKGGGGGGGGGGGKGGLRDAFRNWVIENSAA